MSAPSATESNPPAIAIEHLTKRFPLPWKRATVTAVHDLNLTVAPGEVFGLIGPNGSGKSTTMKIILGLMAPSEGTTQIFGRDSRHVDSRHAVGYLPENPYFYKYLTGREMLSFYGKLCGLRGKPLRQRIDELLELVSLEDARDRRLSYYSKGMLQRVGLAQAIIHQPRLLILDEPTAGVDPAGSRQIRDLILQLKSQKMTVVLSSHLLEQVQEVCDHVGILSQGKLVREGTMESLISIEEQTEILLENASPELQERIAALVADSPATLLRVGHPQTTLERLFLEATENRPVEKPEYAQTHPPR